MKNWDVKKLRDLADIRVSNVDKKIYPSERPVKLCNYMDVYTNEYIDGSIQFMEGSANDAEIERFGLNIGDVIITKDSETPDDIGIPTVIHEQIDNLVCGYHLALIRPDNEKIDSIFLSKYLSTSRVANYFALHASGSTRFGLPIGAIESVEILTPPIKEQTQIATILSTIDRAIEQTEALIAKQQRIKTGLMQDLLTKGIDENGNIRSEETHEFKDSPLGRIPVEWEVKTINDISIKITDGDHHTPKRSIDGIFLLSARNVLNGSIDLSDVDYVPEYEYQRMIRRCYPESGDILISCSGTIGRVCEVPTWLKCVLVRSAALVKLNKSEIQPRFAEWVLQSDLLQTQIQISQRQAAQPNLFQSEIASLNFAKPMLYEQVKISKTLDQHQSLIKRETLSLEKLKILKTGLMQDLLTGKVRVTDLLNQKTAAN
ncbi:MAG: restriction endonuclease subunit S [Microcystis aeruginosa Ma_MB_F_20061100_S19]|uniref:EcoKI restriction-modification system protein HsdS n=1 Tax=Microcystis aeruginosa SPC777 TaxID=482300 RepID=S3J2D0_MICAE|nr:restriction endonuclease subunit S [Microcystis aeruginosa]EPF20038.1 EcoKI restriction-modification system protein HsdS [Microcystis aeruginosa SPC777]OCY15584.1 MAG: restriction endonuclease subunit S [Microcystis aeruginosa CACIAM 03]TRU08819.1 MAG: restriction endonuclease subunit S [Microcystis aeruginosa Ma_MB_F_20061100_S19D]TRU09874.1 MAG: restriction endonuclease subunit S [Microcystis aeruginosa Ma_MB_F_20061100_S19]